MANETAIEMDEFGNLWPRERPVRSHMTAPEFKQLFSGCATVAIHLITDEAYAGGSGEPALERGFEQRGLNPEDFRLEPGPLDGLNFDFLS